MNPSIEVHHSVTSYLDEEQGRSFVVPFLVHHLGSEVNQEPLPVEIIVPDSGQSVDEAISQARAIFAERIVNLHDSLTSE